MEEQLQGHFEAERRCLPTRTDFN